MHARMMEEKFSSHAGARWRVLLIQLFDSALI